jgi:hypothetical protein
MGANQRRTSIERRRSSEPQLDGRWPLTAPVASGYHAARSGDEMEPYDQASVVRNVPWVRGAPGPEGAMSKLNIGIAVIALATVLSAAGYAAAKGGGGGHGGGGHGGGGHGGGHHGGGHGGAHFGGGGHRGGHFGSPAVVGATPSTT